VSGAAGPAVDVPALHSLAPELGVELPAESLADCGACPMAGQPFLSDVRCCTFHPVLPNFLAGRALLRGGVGTDKLRERLGSEDGLDPRGVGPPEGWKEAYEQDREEAFGRRRSWACPLWVEGELSCSIWADRNSTCRSWFCRHVDGAHGQRAWGAWRALGRGAESALARRAAEAVAGPEDPEGVDGWAAYYVACWRWVEALSEDEAWSLRTDHLEGLAAAVVVASGSLVPDMPAHPLPNVRSVAPDGDHVVLVGFSDWQPGRFPARVFEVLGELDGQRSWPEAVARARGRGVDVDPAWGRALFDLDLLREAEL